MSDHAHWQQIYTSKATDRVSWYQPTAQASLDRIVTVQSAPLDRTVYAVSNRGR